MEINDYDVIADLYDIYVPVTFDIDFFLKETQKVDGEVLELMSGTGRVSIPLIEAGVKLTCVDSSARSNAILEHKLAQKGVQADVYQADIRELSIPKPFAMVIIPFHSFAHLISVDDQKKALDRIAHHLQPGGKFICTLGNPALRGQAVDGQLRLAYTYPLADNGGLLLLWILERFDPQDQQVVKAYEFFEVYDSAGALESKRLLQLNFRLSQKDEFEALLKSAGFSIKAFYGDYAYSRFDHQTSPSMVWVLEKTGA